MRVKSNDLKAGFDKVACQAAERLQPNSGSVALRRAVRPLAFATRHATRRNELPANRRRSRSMDPS